MSKILDERVVSMQFDNSQFEKNVKTTMSTLDKLKQALSFKKTDTGLEAISTKTYNTSNVLTNTLGGACNQVGLKFNAMWTIADQTLRNITNSVEATAKRWVSALTIDPIKMGFSEYETQMGAVQTILANTQGKGSTLDDVNAALDELNVYADKTIYNFTEMTRNIGTFTAAGVELDKSVQSIKGIANLAAVSGSTSQQASTAMYQLSQALAAGKVSLMDWNSVVNAGMGGEVFQEALKRTSRMMGTGVDEAIEKFGTFRESLTQGEWLTAEVLTETLAQLSGAYTEADLIAQGFTQEQARQITELATTASDAATKVKTATQLIDTMKESLQSGWTSTWELIVGDFEESKKLWSGISDYFGEIIEGSAKSRNDLLSGALQSNWSKLVTALEDSGVDNTKFTNAVNKALEKHGYVVSDVIDKYGSLEEAFQSGKISSNILKEAIDGLGSSVGDVVDITNVAAGLSRSGLGTAFNADVSTIQQALVDMGYDLGKFGEAANGVDGIFGEMTENAIRNFQEVNGLEVTGIIDQATLDKIYELQHATEEVKGDFQGFIDEIDKLGGRQLLIESIWNILDAVSSVAGTIKKAWTNIFPPMTSEQLYNMIEGFKNFTETLKPNEAMLNRIRIIFEGLFAVVDIIGMAFGAVWDAIKPLFGGLAELGDSLSISAAGWATWIKNLRDSIKENQTFATIMETVVGVIKTVWGVVKKFFSGIGIDLSFGGLLDIVNALVDTIAGFIGVVSQNFAIPGLEALRDFFNDLSFGDDSDTPKISVLDSIKNLLSDFASNFQLVEKVKTLWESIKGFFSGIGEAIKGFFSGIGNGFSGIGAKFTPAFEAIGGLFESLKGGIGGFIEWADSVGLGTLLKDVGLLGVFIQISKFVKRISDPFEGLSDIFKSTAGVINQGKEILTSAAKAFDGVNGIWSNISKGIRETFDGVGGVLNQYKKTLKTQSLKNIAMSLLILAGALYILSKIDADKLETSLVALGTLMVALMAMMSVIDRLKGTSLVAAGVSMIGISAAMIILAIAVKKFAEIEPEGLERGVVAVSTLAIALGLFGRLVSKTKMISAGIGVIAVAAGIALLIPSLRALGKMDESVLAQGLLAIGIALAEFAIALRVMDGTLSGSAALIVAVGALGLLLPVLAILGSLPIAVIAIGLSSIAAALGIFAVAGHLLKPVAPSLLTAASAIALFGVGMLAFGVGLIAAGAGLTAIAVGLGALATAFAAGGTLIAAGIIGIITAIATVLPYVGRKIAEALVEVCDVLSKPGNAKKLGEGMAALIEAAAYGLAHAAPVVIECLLELLIGSLEALVEHAPTLVTLLGEFISSLFITLGDNIADIVTSIKYFTDKLAKALGEAFGDITAEDIEEFIGCIGLLALLAIVLNLVKSTIPGAMIGAAGLGLLVGEIGGIFAGLGALSKVPGFTYLMKEGGEFVETLAGIFGGIVDACKNAGIVDALEVLVAAVLVLGGVPGAAGAAGKGIAILGGLIGEISLILLAFGGLKQVPGFEWLMGQGAEMLCSIAEKLGEVITAFSEIKNLDAFTATVGIFGLLGFKGFGTATAGILSITGIITEIGGILLAFGALKDYFGENEDGVSNLEWMIDEGAELITKIATGLSDVISAFAEIPHLDKLALIIGALGIAGPSGFVAATGGAASLGGLITVIGGILTAFGGLKALFDNDETGENALMWVIGEGTELIKSVATGLGEIIGGFVGAIIGEGAVTATDTLPHVGTNLSNFMLNASSFILGIKSLAADDSTKGLTNILDVIGKIGELALANIAVSHYLPGLSEDMGSYGSVLTAYSESIKGISGVAASEADFDAALKAANAISALSDATPRIGGFAEIWNGTNISLTDFSEDIAKYAESIKTFSTTIAGFATEGEGIASEEDIKAAISAGQGLSDLANTTPNIGGLKQTISGANKDLTDFSSDFPAFATALKEYSTNIKGISTDCASDADVTAAYTIGKGLADISNLTPKTGGWLGEWTGENITLSAFSTDVKDFGAALKNFSTSVVGIDAEACEDALEVAKSLASISLIEVGEGGIGDFFSDLIDLSVSQKYGGTSAFTQFGEALTSFYDAVDGIDISRLTGAKDVLVDIVDQIKTYNNTSLGSLDTDLEDLSSAFSTFSTKVGGIDSTVFDTAISNIADLKETISGLVGLDTSGVETYTTAINTLSSGVADSFATGLTSEVSATNIKTAMLTLLGNTMIAVNENETALNSVGERVATYIGNGMGTETTVAGITTTVGAAVGTIVSAFEPHWDRFRTQGLILMAKVAKGFYDATAALKAVTASVIYNCADEIDTKYNDFYSGGQYLVQGFAAGITDETWRAEVAASSMAASAIESAKTTLDSHSPSREFIKIGSYIPMGMAKGIDSLSGLVEDSSIAMSKNALSSTAGVLSKLGSMVETDIDTQPTIRPILDLSDVESKTGLINTMFGASTVGSISATFNRNGQNGKDAELVSALTDLRKDLGKFGNTSNNYNINGITYDNGSEISSAVETLVRAARIERRS